MVWREGLAGRSAPEIASSFHAAITKERSTSSFIYWADNCMALNKNWIIFSCLIILVNSSKTNVYDVTIKYFQPGHTFMSADSVHAGVEKEMQKAPSGSIYDFQDFVEIIKQSNSGKMDVLEVDNETFLNWTKQQANAKLKQLNFKLKNIVCVKFVRGRKDMMYKLSHEENDFRELNFLKKRSNITSFPAKICNAPCGLPPEKNSILSKGLPNSCPSREKGFGRHWKYQKMQLARYD